MENTLYSMYLKFMPDKSSRERFWAGLKTLVLFGVIMCIWVALPISSKCILLETTGFRCPFCGGTRAVIKLLHGDIINAFYYNSMVVLGLPVALIYLVVKFKKFVDSGEVRLTNFEVYTAIFVLIAFLIARNLWR